MKILTTYYSSRFKKSLKKYRSHKTKIVKKINLFLENPFHKNLKTHKLSGKLNVYWSFSINHHWRILFEFIDQNTVGFIDIGTHEIYK